MQQSQLRLKWLLSVILTVLFGLYGAGTMQAQDGGTANNGNRLFVDDFTTYVNRWDRVISAKYSIDYADFGYQFSIRSPGVEVWAKPISELYLDRYAIEVTALADATNSEDGFWGLLINYQDDDNFYVFGIDGIGHYEMRLRKDGQWNIDALASGTVVAAAEYHLRVEDDGGDFSISINAEAAVVFNNIDLNGGAFGLYAQAGHGPLLVSFDDYVVHDLE